MIIMMICLNMMFIFMNHPMSMGVLLIIQTLMISVWSGMMAKTFWMSYILTITMLSGMLVLFIYMSSTASNEKFKNSMKMWVMLILSLMTSMIFLFLAEKMIIKNNYSGMEMKLFKTQELIFLNKMFNKENYMLTIMMVLYLLYSMIVSSQLVNISEGSMRIKI